MDNPNFNPPNYNTLNRLARAFEVDQSILRCRKRFVIIRFGQERHADCNNTDTWLAADAGAISDKADIYAVENYYVPELVARYRLYGPSTILFFSNNTVVHRLSQEEINTERSQGKRFSEIVQWVENKNSPISVPPLMGHSIAQPMSMSDDYELYDNYHQVPVRQSYNRFGYLRTLWPPYW